MRINVSDILEKKDGDYIHKDLAEAFLKFAKSDVGIEFLSKFAEAGQVIAGHEYTESGKFDKQGIDLSFHAENRNYRLGEDSDTQGNTGPNGETYIRGGKGSMEIRGRGTIDVLINSELNTNNKDAENYKKNSDNLMSKLLYILSRTETIFHEVIIHANSYAEDITDDCSLNCSNLKGNYENNDHGYNQHKEARQPGSLFLKKALPIMVNMHKEGKTSLSEKDIKKRMLNYKD